MRQAIMIAFGAGFATSVVAQDSVSSTGNGDALDAYGAATQQVNYIVDLAPFTTSWGTQFGIAPIIKSSDGDGAGAGLFTSLVSAQAISKDVLCFVPAPASSYDLWTTAGAGVNPAQNTAGIATTPPAATHQFGVTFAEFSGNYNGVISGLVNFDPQQPSRLFVQRVGTAVNGADSTQNTAQFGVGSIDADGNSYFRADDFGTAGGVVDDNLFRTRIGARGLVLNQIGGVTDATDSLLLADPDAHLTPNNIPASIAGGNGVLVTTNFAGEFVNGGAAPLTVTAGLPGLIGNADQRGAFGSTTATPLGGSYTFAITQESAGAADQESIGVFATDAAGNIIIASAVDLDLPAVVSDPLSGYNLDTVNGIGIGAFEGHSSQTAFRGGTGQIAVHEDENGDLIVAGTAYDVITSGDVANDTPYNAIVVARQTSIGTTWSVAAHSSDNAANLSAGKDILDGPGGAVIGRLCLLLEVTGGAPLGPSLSQPAFDASGNIWFIGAVALDKVDTMGNPFVDFDSALIRAVYDASTFSYELELVLELGQVFTGPNSGTDYQVQFLQVADNNSISSGSFFSSNVSSRSFNEIDVNTLSQSDSRTTAGVVLQAEIVYDADGDGDFEDPTAGGGNPASADESYNALLYIGHAANPCSIADVAPPFGVLDLSDIDAFNAAFASTNKLADVAAPFGVIDLSDINAFIAAFFAGCP